MEHESHQWQKITSNFRIFRLGASVGIKYQDGVKMEHTVITIRAWSELLGCRAKELGSEENRVPWRLP